MMPAGPWIQTASGKAFDFTNPVFDIHDIAHHLSRINRYTGAILPEWYSVAEHSVRVAYYAKALADKYGADPVKAFKAGLLHDAHEAYLNDLSSPLKRMAELEGYRELDEIYVHDVADDFGIEWPWAIVDGFDINLVKEADLSMLDLERPVLLSNPPFPWTDLGRLPKVAYRCPTGFWVWRPNAARDEFMAAARVAGLL